MDPHHDTPHHTPPVQPPPPQPVSQHSAGPFTVAPPLAGTAPAAHPLPGRTTRNVMPRGPISEEAQRRHQESKHRYPMLSLSAGEYVIETVRRHPIGLLSIWAFVVFLSLVIIVLLPLYAANVPAIAEALGASVESLPTPATMAVPMLILLALFGLGGFIATIVYNGNRFYMTNESIVQFVQTSLFNTQRQVINLINVEDASSTQHGILQQVLNYGTLRLSTQGEKTIYEFHFVANPQRVVNVINDTTEKAVMRMQGLPTTEY